MPKVPYDRSRESLIHAGGADDFFRLGDHGRDDALCAEMARLAYVPDTRRLETYLARAGFELHAAFRYHKAGTQAFIAIKRGSDICVIAFRGTQPNDPSDLFTDARFIQAAWHDASGTILGHVHQGFCDAAHDDQVFRELQVSVSNLPSKPRVLITGHSLGAAMATLLATWLPSAELYTFGSPRVGDAALVANLKNPVCVRVVNCSDLVTRVPPAWLLGYTHTGGLCYLDRNGTRILAPTKENIRADRDIARDEYRINALVFDTAPTRELADHAPINYVSGVMGIRT